MKVLCVKFTRISGTLGKSNFHRPMGGNPEERKKKGYLKTLFDRKILRYNIIHLKKQKTKKKDLMDHGWSKKQYFLLSELYINIRISIIIVAWFLHIFVENKDTFRIHTDKFKKYSSHYFFTINIKEDVHICH